MAVIMYMYAVQFPAIKAVYHKRGLQARAFFLELILWNMSPMSRTKPDILQRIRAGGQEPPRRNLGTVSGLGNTQNGIISVQGSCRWIASERRARVCKPDPEQDSRGEGGGIYHLLEWSGREPSNWQFPVPGGGRKIKKTLRRSSVIETLSTSNGDRKEMAASLQHRKQDELVRV
jgi:hypothetical protein